MIFRFEVQEMKRNKTVPILTPTGRTRSTWLVGKAWSGWLSPYQEWKAAQQLRNKAPVFRGDAGFRTWLRKPDGKLEIVSCGSADAL